LSLRISPGGQAGTLGGAQLPSLTRIWPGGHSGGTIGSQAPPGARNSPGAHGRCTGPHVLPSAPTKRLLQHDPSGILV
jgi:hypothetical protein